MWHTALPIAEYARLRDAALQQAHALRREAINAAWRAAGRGWRTGLRALWRQALCRPDRSAVPGDGDVSYSSL
ncbi:MAG: hypothetical protein O9331_08765 [Acidovorax sp.]|nr:hypothetical protein [Acidovorax sp.]